MNPHIVHDFDEALGELRKVLLNMAGQTLQNLEHAIRGLMDRDADLCRVVIADDTEVDDAEKELDRMGIELLTRFRPLATDLRCVIATMKVAINLERISDHAVNIAKRAKKMAKRPELPETRSLLPLYEMADAILRDALSSFIDGREELALSLAPRDKEIDRLHKRLAREFSARLEESEGRGEDFLHLILVGRSLERVGDLAVNISEDAVFLESATDIRYEGRRKAAPGEEAADDRRGSTEPDETGTEPPAG
jgi:phosphate transport system protein